MVHAGCSFVATESYRGKAFTLLYCPILMFPQSHFLLSSLPPNRAATTARLPAPGQDQALWLTGSWHLNHSSSACAPSNSLVCKPCWGACTPHSMYQPQRDPGFSSSHSQSSAGSCSGSTLSMVATAGSRQGTNTSAGPSQANAAPSVLADRLDPSAEGKRQLSCAL